MRVHGKCDPFGYSAGETLRAYIVGHFDEGGKFKDHDITCFAGFLANPYAWEYFNDKWGARLRNHGLRRLQSAKALRFASPLSPELPARGIDDRVSALMKYVKAIHDHVEFGVACAVDAAAFRALPDAQQRKLKAPHSVAFRCVLGAIKEHIKKSDTVSLLCNDESAFSVECYKIFSSIRQENHGIRNSFISIGFADDFHFPQIQAADLFAGLLRRDAERRFLEKPFQMQALFDDLLRPPQESSLQVRGHFFGQKELAELAP